VRLVTIEQLAAHQITEEHRGVLGVGDDPAVGALGAVHIRVVGRLVVRARSTACFSDTAIHLEPSGLFVAAGVLSMSMTTSG